MNFYPRPPREGRLRQDVSCRLILDISTHALREKGDLGVRGFIFTGGGISTHALREKGDRVRNIPHSSGNISTHALREKGDPSSYRAPTLAKVFLPTPSARRATLRASSDRFRPLNFYPRPPREGRPVLAAVAITSGRFLPTPSARRATPYCATHTVAVAISTHALREKGDGRNNDYKSNQRISTHALREKGDFRITYIWYSNVCISTHALREKGDTLGEYYIGTYTISTHALREKGDPPERIDNIASQISTHALREKGDLRKPKRPQTRQKFLPTPSARRATTLTSPPVARYRAFLPTPSARRATFCSIMLPAVALFLPTPSARRATLGQHIVVGAFADFYPRPPREGRRQFYPFKWF